MARRPHPPPSGSPLWRRVIQGTSALAIFLATASAAGSAATEAVLAVSARVLPRATLQVRSAPLDLVVSLQDVRQAYVDAPEPTRLEVSNNSPQGYVLLVSPTMPGITALRVRGGGVQVTLAGDGGAIPERGHVGLRMPLSLRYRFMLDRRVAPGRYAWPVQLTVRPLAP
ncbi:MAG TPA: hypothetical protein VJ738_17810 [Steroidobacteraceae bacterium]|nr:hypothetical protein [Steroidobacteraceae bacterium]